MSLHVYFTEMPARPLEVTRVRPDLPLRPLPAPLLPLPPLQPRDPGNRSRRRLRKGKRRGAKEENGDWGIKCENLVHG